MTSSRRQFLSVSSFSLGSLLLVSPVKKAQGAFLETQEWTIYGGGSSDKKFFVALTNELGSKNLMIPINFKPHSFVLHPTDDNLILVMSKQSRFGIIDLKKGAVVEEVHAQKDFSFSGHGVFTPDFSHYFTAESSLLGKEGILVLRDAKTFQIKKTFNSHGICPHDLIIKDNEIIVLNAGRLEGQNITDLSLLKKTIGELTKSELSNVSYFNVQNGQWIRTVYQEEKNLSMKHFALSKTGEIAVGMKNWNHVEGKASPLALIHNYQIQNIPLTKELITNNHTEFLPYYIPKTGELATLSISQEKMLIYKKNDWMNPQMITAPRTFAIHEGKEGLEVISRRGEFYRLLNGQDHFSKNFLRNTARRFSLIPLDFKVVTHSMKINRKSVA